MPMSGSILQLASRQLPLESITGSGLQIVGSLPQWGQAVDFSYPFNWQALHSFLQGLNSSGSLTFIGQQNIGTTSSANLIMSPEGDLILDPTGNDVLPNLNYDINLGALTKKYLTLYASELWVETLVAQSTIATIGGRILVGPTTTLVNDLSDVATTIVVKHNQMTINNIVYMEADGKVEFMQIASGSSGTSGSYIYSVTRNLDGSGANFWYAGDAMFNTGTAGSGFIDLYSISGIKSGAGPTIVGNIRNSNTYNDWSEYWAIGNLNGLYGYGATTYGVGLGKYSAGMPHLTIDSTNGIRIFNGLSTVVGKWDTTGSIVVGQESTTTDSIVLTPSGSMLFRSGSTTVIDIGTNQGVLLGQTTSGQNNLFFSSGCMLFRNATTRRVEIKSNGVMTINDSSGNAVFTFDASSGAEITKKLSMSGSDSAIAIGATPPSGSANGTGIWIDKNGLYGVQANTTQAYINGSGILYGGGGNVIISSSGISISSASANSYIQTKSIDFLSGSFLVGDIWGWKTTGGAGGGLTIQAESNSGSNTELFLSARGNGAIRLSSYQSDLLASSLYISDANYFTGNIIAEFHGIYLGANISPAIGNMGYSGCLISYKNSTEYPGYIFVPSGSLTSTSFDGDSFSTTAKTLIDLSSEFGLPANIKAVLAYVAVQDSGAASTECYVFLSPNNTSATGMGVSCFPANDRYNRQTVIVPCDSNGDIYYQVLASGAGTLDLFIRIWGYWI